MSQYVNELECELPMHINGQVIGMAFYSKYSNKNSPGMTNINLC